MSNAGRKIVRANTFQQEHGDASEGPWKWASGQNGWKLKHVKKAKLVSRSMFVKTLLVLFQKLSLSLNKS